MKSCGGSHPRPLLEKAYEDLNSGSVVVAVAPTSYGKTIASPWMWKRARDDGLAKGLVHVAPLQSLVRRVFEDIFKPCGGRLQMHGAEENVKSPYFLSSLVVSTLDSFLWNLYRIPVAEALKIQRGSSMGHYYPALFSIFTSLVVFDEGHMYLWEEPSQGDPASAGTSAALAAIVGLTWAGAPVLVETATAQPGMLAEVKRIAKRMGGRVSIKILKAPWGSSSCPYLDKLMNVAGTLDPVKDHEWESKYLVPWETRIKDSWGSVVGDIASEAGSAPVLVITNTVKEAVSLYNMLAGKVNNITLIHGRLSIKDRLTAENKLRDIEDKGGVIVATQVAEAGLDANVAAVYTAAAPLENLIQRAGRACRRDKILDACRNNKGKLVIVAKGDPGPYHRNNIDKALELVSEIASGKPDSLDWRAPCNYDSVTGYGSLIAMQSTGSQAAGLASLGNLLDLFVSYLQSDARPWVLLELLDRANLCGVARDSVMVEVDVGDSTVPVSLEWVLKNAEKILEFRENGPVIIVGWSWGGSGNNFVEGVASELWKISRQGGGCQLLIRALAQDAKRVLKDAGVYEATYTVRLKAKKAKEAKDEVYKGGLGLLV